MANVETYLGRMTDAISPFLRDVERTWNEHRDRMTLRGTHFSADLVFVPRGIVLVADVPTYLRPFRGAIRERVRGALATIVDDGKPGATPRKSTRKLKG